MIDPTGPLPPEVYWRRRVAAVAVSVAAVVLLAWLIGRLVDGGADEGPARPASAARASLPPSRPPAVPASASATTNVGTPAPAATPAAPPAPAPVPAPPGPCPDPAIQVFAEAGAPGYRIGQRPLLRLVVVNAGQVACVRDVSRTSRELVVTGPDGTRLWSSNDCYVPPPGADSRLLQPGERLTFAVNWAGRTSAPGCPSRRRAVPPGSYLVTGRLGPVASAPMPLRLDP